MKGLIAHGCSVKAAVSNSLKKSLAKLNKTGVIKNLQKSFRNPLGAGIKGIGKPGSDSDDPTPRKL